MSVCEEKTHNIFITENDSNIAVADVSICIRMRFIRKMYCILATQFIVTSLVGSVALFTPLLRFYISENYWLLTLAFFLCSVLLALLIVKRREFPINGILLTAFSAVEAYLVAVIVAYYDQLAVLQAFISITCTMLGLTVYTFQYRREFSPFCMTFSSCLFVFSIAGFLKMLLGSTQAEMLLSSGSAAVFSCYIAYETHAILHRLSVSEYIVGAIDLYTDVINYSFQIISRIFLMGKRALDSVLSLF